MKKILFILLILMSYHQASGHSDRYIIFKFGNIHTRIKTGFNYEQINVAKIIAKLTQKISNKLNYKKPILLDFNHAYTKDIEPDYFISFGKGKINYRWKEKKQKGLLKTKGMVIRQVSHNFDIEATLKLIEFSINNVKKIKKEQLEIVYNKHYHQWKIPTIDTLTIQEIIQNNPSELIDEIIAQKTFLGSTNWNYGISYFYQNKQFHFLVKAYNGVKDTIALSTNSLFQVTSIDPGTKLVFDTDSTFYCVGWYDQKRVVSKQQRLKSVRDKYRLFRVENIGDDLVSINFIRFRTKDEFKESKRGLYFENTSIYDIKNDKLVDNIRELIESQ